MSDTSDLLTLLGSAAVACYDADVGITKTGSNVTVWADQTTNGYNLGLNAVGGGEASPNSPVFNASGFNSKASLDFADTGGRYLATTSSVVTALSSSSFSVFAAVRWDSTGDLFSRIISFNATGASNDHADSGSCAFIVEDTANDKLWTMQTSNGYGTFGSPLSGQEHRYGVTYNRPGASLQVTQYRDNVQIAQSSVPSTVSLASTGQLSVGDGAGSGGRFLTGTVRRIIVTNTLVSSSDRSSIDTWLQGPTPAPAFSVTYQVNLNLLLTGA